MKKLILMVLVVALAASLVLVGCGETKTTSPATSAPATSAPAQTTAPAPATSAAAPPKTSGPVTSMAPPPTTAGTQAKKGGVIRLIFTEAPTGSIGIPENMKGFSVFYTAPMLESFVKRNPDNSYAPVLAESWEWSSDNLTLTLHLRKGVKFHDGADFNANVAKWNLDRSLAAKRAGTDNVASVEKTDDYTIVVKIKKYQNTWFGDFAAMGTQISPVNVSANGEAYVDWNPVGTGPFKFKEYKENDYLELVRFDDYWGPKALLDGVKAVFIADTVTQQMSFEAGEGDILESVEGAAAADLLKKGYVLDMSPGLGTMMVPSSGVDGSPFVKKEVREAVEYAINKDAIIKAIGLGYWRSLNQLVGSDKMGYVSSLAPRKIRSGKIQATPG